METRFFIGQVRYGDARPRQKVWTELAMVICERASKLAQWQRGAMRTPGKQGARLGSNEKGA